MEGVGHAPSATAWATPDANDVTSTNGSEKFREWCNRKWRATLQPKHFPVALLIASYVGWFSYLSWKLYYGYGYPAFDLAIFDQGMWLLTHFHIPFVTVMGRNLFGDHTSFILLLVAPVYRLFPEPQGLLTLQTLAIAGAAIPIYRLGQKLIHNTAIATIMVAVFLLNPALEQGNMQQFHPEAFQVLIISVAIYAAVESKGVLLGVMVVFSLLVKEDAALLIVPIGLWVLWRRDKKWGLWIVAGAVAWTAFALEVVIPNLLGRSSLYGGDIPYGGVSGFVRALFTTPRTFFSYFVHDGRPFYVWQLGFTTGWGFLFSPEIAVIALLAVFENVVSTLPYMHQLMYQFSMPIVPILVVGTIWAIRRQPTLWRRDILTGITLTCALSSCVLWGLAPFSHHTAVSQWPPNGTTVRAINALEQKIPPNAVVSAYYLFVAHLDHRAQIYLWPTPFETGNYGLFNNNGTTLPVAKDVQYLLLLLPINVDEGLTTYNAIAKHFTLVSSRDGIGLFKRISK